MGQVSCLCLCGCSPQAGRARSVPSERQTSAGDEVAMSMKVAGLHHTARSHL